MPGGVGQSQPDNVCGVADTTHSGALVRIVLSLQPQFGAGLPFRFTKPIWEEEATLCEYHLYPADYEEPPVPLPESWTPPVYRMGVASDEGVPVRLIWAGEIVE